MRLDHLILGYAVIKTEDTARAASLLLKLGLSAAFTSEGEIRVSLPRLNKYKKALGASGYTVSEPLGIPPMLKRCLLRPGISIGCILLLAIYAFTALFIWDVRVSGNENMTASEVEEELRAVGLSVGEAWRGRSFDEIERELLRRSSRIGWINITRRGNVAYVGIKEKKIPDPPKVETVYSNVVASRDCVIEEITVRSGVACVKVGDTVKAGELLISGVIPSELGGGFVFADGDVFAAVRETVTAEASRKENITTYGEPELSEISVKILKFSINIFKSYRKNENECVIIENEKECFLFGRYRLPISVSRSYKKEVTESEVVYTDGELVSVASARLAKKRIAAIGDADLLKIKTYGEYTEGGYAMTSELTVLKNVSEKRGFADASTSP